MEPMYYIGLDVHKRKISYCVKDSGGKVYSEGSLSATRLDKALLQGVVADIISASVQGARSIH